MRWIFVAGTLAVSSACADDADVSASDSGEPQTYRHSFLSNVAVTTALREVGVDVHDGVEPPDIQGLYSALVATVDWSYADSLPFESIFLDFCFHDQSDAHTVRISDFGADGQSFGLRDHEAELSGRRNSFTLSYVRDTDLGVFDARLAGCIQTDQLVWSGTLTPDGVFDADAVSVPVAFEGCSADFAGLANAIWIHSRISGEYEGACSGTEAM